MCFCYLGGFIVVSWIFYKDPGFPLVCLTIGSSVGQFVLPALYELLIATYTWSGAFLVVSSIALQCLPFGLIIHSARDYYVTGNEDDETVTISKGDTYSSLMSDVLIWIILGNCLLVALTGDTFMYLTSKRCIHLLYSKSCIRRRSLKQIVHTCCLLRFHMCKLSMEKPSI